LEKKPSIKLSQEAWVGVKVKVKRPGGCVASHAVVSRETCAEWLSRMTSIAGHRRYGAMALVLVIAHHGRAAARQRWELRSRRRDRLDAGLLVIGDDGLVSVDAGATAGVNR
jgi:hypothetical protein